MLLLSSFATTKIKRLCFCLFVTSLVACNNPRKTDIAPERTDGFSEKPKSKEDSLLKKVLSGHDIGMARMGKMSKYLKQIQAELDSMVKLPAKKIDQKYQQTLIDLQEDLNYAEYGMNTWMEKFIIDSAKDNPTIRIKYLEEEGLKVGAVKEAILSSLSRADSLFKKNNPK